MNAKLHRAIKAFLLFLSLFLCKDALYAQETFDEETAYKQMYRVIARPAETPDGADLVGLDAGSSDFIRQLFNMNDLTSDIAVCCWGDPGIPEFVNGTWDHNNILANGMYTRLEYAVHKCNLYLENAGASQTQRRAEARFLRAMLWWYMLDLYGSAPIATSSEQWSEYSYNPVEIQYPPQRSREEIFSLVEAELKEAVTDMAEPGTNTYGRADKAAAWLMLARLYLNSEVYTGSVRWAEAKEYADKVINNADYSLTPKYPYLFMGDNDKNGAQKEIILPLEHDGVNGQNYSGTTFLISSISNWEMPSTGLGGWGGNRARKELVRKFFPFDNAPFGTTESILMAAGDDRALLYGQNRTLDVTDLKQFANGFSVTKWTNLHSDGSTPNSTQFADTDFPLLRKAEAYLIYAEADARLNGGTCSAQGVSALNTLRARANAAAKSSWTLAEISDEWAREFYFEGRRRTDLVRFGKFTSGSYVWQWKGGEYEGKAIDSYRTVFAIPTTVMGRNENYVQNEGYYDVNKIQLDPTFVLNTPAFASSVVSLEDYGALEFTWVEPKVTGCDTGVSYVLEVAEDENFTQQYRTHWGTGIPGMGYVRDADRILLPTEWLDCSLVVDKLWAKRMSDFSDQPVELYVRCCAEAGFKKSVSNTIKITVKPYFTACNSKGVYITGSAIGNGGNIFGSDAVGSALLPLDLSLDNYYDACESHNLLAPHNMGTQTLYIDKDKSFTIGDIQGRHKVTSPDGTAENASWNYSANDKPISVSESGWYNIRLVPSRWVGQDMVPFLTVEKTDVPGGDYTAVKLSGDMDADLQPCATENNRMWYVRINLTQESKLHFTCDGKTFGDTGFSFGYATEGGADFTVPAGEYIVTFNAATGYYDFLNPSLSDDAMLYDKKLAYEADGKLKAVSAGTVDISEADEETDVKVCDFDNLALGVTLVNMKLFIGDRSCDIGSDGTVSVKDLNELVAPLRGQSGGAASAKKQGGVSALGRQSVDNAGQTMVDAYIKGEYIENGVSVLKQSNVFSLAVILPMPPDYYVIGYVNYWNSANKDYKLHTTDGVTYEIEVPGPLNADDGWFKIAHEDNYNLDNFWNGSFFAPYYDGNSDLEGQFQIDDQSVSGAWQLPILPEGYHYYNLSFNLNTMSYVFTPLVASGIMNVETPQQEAKKGIYTLSGQRVGADLNSLPSGVYVVNGRKVVKK